MTPPSPCLRNLVRDDRGAVMVIGLFMAMFLIGAMWTVVGIGDALVYRDKVQEVADHVAFSAATVQARGMNLIAVINLIMLAIVAVYLVIDLIDRILEVVHITASGVCDSVYGSETGCTVDSYAAPAYEAADKVRNTYYDAMKPVLIGLSWTQTAAAMVAPYGGVAASIEVAGEYKETGFGMSMSMIPGFAVTGGLFNGSYDFTKVLGGGFGTSSSSSSSTMSFKGSDGRLGLPVKNEKMNQLCVYSADAAIRWIEGWLQAIPVIGQILDLPGLEQTINGIISSDVTSLSCDENSDSFWGRDGPKAPYDGQDYDTGASDWHQVYGIVFGSQKDVSEQKVGVALGPKAGFGHTNTTKTGIYQAQAEIYFDCETKWTDESCNRPASALSMIPHAMYSMRWTARMRRVHWPDLQGMAVQWLSGVFTSNNVLGPLKGKIAGTQGYQDVEKGIQNVGGALGGGAAGSIGEKVFGNVLRQGNGPSTLDQGLGWLTGKIPGMANPPANGIIH